MPGDGDAELLRDWQDGDEDAARQLYERYSRRLKALVEKRLSEKMRRRVDPVDIVQSAFRSFFHRGERGDFAVSENGDLWGLLLDITLAKLCSRARFETAAKRDVNAEASPDQSRWYSQLLGDEPSPADAAALVDQIEAVLAKLPPLYGDVFALRLAGTNRREIARQLEISRQTVYRALDMIRSELTKLDGPAHETA